MRVIIGMDPHKRSATIEVIDRQARVLATGTYGTDNDGYGRMLCGRCCHAPKSGSTKWVGLMPPERSAA